jgi:hypothetical protein
VQVTVDSIDRAAVKSSVVWPGVVLQEKLIKMELFEKYLTNVAILLTM